MDLLVDLLYGQLGILIVLRQFRVTANDLFTAHHNKPNPEGNAFIPFQHYGYLIPNICVLLPWKGGRDVVELLR